MSNTDLTVLFVCTGNTCRSSMAEQLFNLKAKDLSAHAFSAGLDAKPGSSMSLQAAEAMAALGYNSTAHSSTLLSVEAVEEADVILTFTQGQKIELGEGFPAAIEKVFTISEFANRGSGISVDVSDPYGRGAEVYKETAETIDSLVELIVSSLKAS